MAKKKDKTVQAQKAADASAPDEAELEELLEDAVDGGSWPVDKLKPVLEAVLFAAGDPLPVKRLTDLIAGASRLEVGAALTDLQGDYEGRGVGLLQVAGGWQMRTAPEHQSVIKKLFKERPFRLTRAAMETLAIVAYRQPVTRAEVESVRGVDCSGVLESLVERKVMKIAGRRDVPGRPLVYATTPLFLEMFSLKDLKALPTLAELGDEFTNLAEHTGFSESEEREAAVLPFEGEDGEGEEQTTNAQDYDEVGGAKADEVGGAEAHDVGASQDSKERNGQAGEQTLDGKVGRSKDGKVVRSKDEQVGGSKDDKVGRAEDDKVGRSKDDKVGGAKDDKVGRSKDDDVPKIRFGSAHTRKSDYIDQDHEDDQDDDDEEPPVSIN